MVILAEYIVFDPVVVQLDLTPCPISGRPVLETFDLSVFGHGLARRRSAVHVMRPEFIIVYVPRFGRRSLIVKRKKPVQIQTLVPEAAVKRFDERIVRGFSAS